MNQDTSARSHAEHEHKADLLRIPAPLRGLAWEQYDERKEYEDGDRLLVAVPVCTYSRQPERGWYYELAVVSVSCDEHYFAVELDGGDDWGWELSDVDWLVRL